MRIEWREDVRKWHPGQAWIWEPGGFGMFDPGINALSIATRIFPGALFVRKAELLFPENKQAPIAAKLHFESPAGEGPFEADFDWRQRAARPGRSRSGPRTATKLLLADGGERLSATASRSRPKAPANIRRSMRNSPA